MTPKKRSIHIGTNVLDRSHYRGAFLTLDACGNDVDEMAKLARARNFDAVRTLVNEEATSGAVTAAMEEARAELGKGDLLVVSFSGHGTRVPNQPPHDPEGDGRDEAICLYDRMLLDDDIYRLLATFAPGVRILLLVDSCHSGSIAVVRRRGGRPRTPGGAAARRERGVAGAPLPPRDSFGDAWGWNRAIQSRTLSPGDARATYDAQRSLYDGLRVGTAGEELPRLRASVILISACKEWEQAHEDGALGLFTRTVVDRVRSGRMRSHEHLVNEVHARTSRFQRPEFLVLGPADPEFERGAPFGG